VLHGHTILEDQSSAVLLTDISDVSPKTGFSEKLIEIEPRDAELESLDRPDGTSTLSPEEKKELEQLERWEPLSESPGEKTDPDSADSKSEETPTAPTKGAPTTEDAPPELPPPGSPKAPSPLPENEAKTETQSGAKDGAPVPPATEETPPALPAPGESSSDDLGRVLQPE
jgi:hypothetical protein